MDPIQAALADLESQEPGEKLSYRKLAAKHGVSYSTLARRAKGIQGLIATKAVNQRKLSPQQEMELVRYIESLTKRGLPPTREMIRNFASQIAKGPVGEGWVTRFLARNKDYLTF
jgi:DNA-binding transcriptional regulator YhcF (GntR family)